jgi:hypothetical protein
MRLVPYFLGLGLSVVALGCSSSTTATTTIARPELVSVSPDDFVGSVGCGSAPDQVQSYVATLFDVTPGADGSLPDPGVQLASSAPTSCLQPVTFSYVVTAHRYLAQVDAFNVAPGEITPLAPGGRLQFDKNQQRVAPLWTYTCGGYPATPGDGGSFGGAGSLGESAAGAAGADEFPPGILTYDGITQTTHDCRAGLPPVTN